MSIEAKTRLEVQTILRSCIIECFNKYHQDGWSVIEFANASFQKADKVVLMNYVRSQREGWQAFHYDTSEQDEYSRSDEWIETQHWQIHVLLKRTPETEDDAILAEDIAQLLVSWFNGVGNEYLRKRGCSNLRIDTENIFVYNDDSELYQKRAVFTVRLQVPKKLSLDAIYGEILKPEVAEI